MVVVVVSTIRFEKNVLNVNFVGDGAHSTGYASYCNVYDLQSANP